MSDVLVLHFDRDKEAADRLVAAINDRSSSRAYTEDDAPDRKSRRKAVIVLWSSAALASDQHRHIMQQRMFEALAHDELVLASLDRTRLPFGFNDFTPVNLLGWAENSSTQGFHDLLVELEELTSRAAFALDAATETMVNVTEFMMNLLTVIAAVIAAAITYDAAREYGVVPEIGSDPVELVDISAMQGYLEDANSIARQYRQVGITYSGQQASLAEAQAQKAACDSAANGPGGPEASSSCGSETLQTEDLEQRLASLSAQRDQLRAKQKAASADEGLDRALAEKARLERELAITQAARAEACRERPEYLEYQDFSGNESAEYAEGKPNPTLLERRTSKQTDMANACRQATKAEEDTLLQLRIVNREIEILQNVPRNFVDYAGMIQALEAEIARIQQLLEEGSGECTSEQSSDAANCADLELIIAQTEQELDVLKQQLDRLLQRAGNILRSAKGLSENACDRSREVRDRSNVSSTLKAESAERCQRASSAFDEIERIFISAGMTINIVQSGLQTRIRTAGLSMTMPSSPAGQQEQEVYSTHWLWGTILNAMPIKNRYLLTFVGFLLSFMVFRLIRFGIPLIARRAGWLQVVPRKKLVNSNIHYDAFISYSHRNKAQVLRLVSDLRAVGLKVWVDEEGIMMGQNWTGSIVGAIRNANHFVLMGSNAAYASPNCFREINVAAIHNRDLKPIIIEDAQITDDFLYFLAAVQQLFVKGMSRQTRRQKFRDAFGL